jgi:hypothetical protein
MMRAPDEAGFLAQLDVYIGECFRQFGRTDGLLAPDAWDLYATNGIIDHHSGEYSFIDREYKACKPLEKTYVLWRIIQSVAVGERAQKLYKLFCGRLRLEYKPFWCAHWETLVFNGILAKPYLRLRVRLLAKPAAMFCPFQSGRQRIRDKIISCLPSSYKLYRRYFQE